MIAFKKLPFDVSQVFLTSDTHFGHKNICAGDTTWGSPHNEACRNFTNTDAMNAAIVNGINAMVGEKDLLIHCGDWSFGGKENIWNFRQRLNCKNVILMQGNHDHNIGKEHVRGGLFTEFVQIGFYQVESLKFVCCHYPIAIWHQSHHNVPLFYGHVHGSFTNPGKSLDVGIDNIFKTTQVYEPIALKTAWNICQNKPAFLESHHDEFTN
ncbi:metallophosphoesterase [Dyadobacter sp. CY326]|uniref:metallophosphoesterase n=1 Tax=Dyadobacter sp. CY326 TaxID=2907300 RepID=UPI001F260E35|nr:metallophosphoesterase [Dyadobacter sp. CY326]MCE7064079.1 hypothetical protein [Dyadobacter sp. CY326]